MGCVADSDLASYVIVRYSPFSPEGVEKNAHGTVAEDLECGREPRWGVSAFGAQQLEDESLEEVVVRICHVADKRGKTIAVLTRQDLESIGMVASPDEPPELHHLIGVDEMREQPDYAALSRLMDERRIRNPLHTR